MLPPLGNPFYPVIGIAVRDMIRARFRAGGQPGASWPPPRHGGEPLRGKNDSLAKNINYLVRPGPSGGAEISVGTTDERAAIHHFGGVIRPKTAKALFLPLTEKGRRIGPRPKNERAAAEAKVVSAWNAGDKQLANRLDSQLLEQGVDFILVGQVTMPARPFLFLAPEQKEELKRLAIYELKARGFFS